MAVDPFTQQIIQFYSCSTAIEGELAKVPFSNNYTAGLMASPRGRPMLDSQMQLAMYSGLLDPPMNASAALDFECRTGNCTFPSTDDGATFLTLALESRCADISNDISISVNERTEDSSNYTYVTTTTSILDYGIQLDNISSLIMQSGFGYSDDSPSSSLLKISFLMLEKVHGVGSQHMKAFECEFSPVVNTYSANITNGVLLEQVLDTQRMQYWSNSQFSTQALLLVNRTVREGEWHECTSSGEPSDEHNLPVNNVPTKPYMYTEPGLGPGAQSSDDSPGTDSSRSNYSTSWWPQDCVYLIAETPTAGLGASLHGFLGRESLEFDYWNKRAKGNLWSVNLWRNGSATLETVQAAMDGLSQSITARWRQGDEVSNNVGPVVGTVWGDQTCVRVNWVWISLPAGLLLLTIVFLVLIITRTRSKRAHVWKSSIFAVLFSGLDQDTRKADGPVGSLEDMKVAAERATVRLEDTKEGFRLVGQV